MIVIGVDTHKRSHALAAVDGSTARVRGSREIPADADGHLDAVRWARNLDGERVWAIEDCRHVSGRLEQALLAGGEHVIRVAPHLMGVSRKGEREPGKSDQIDSLAVARAVVRDGVDRRGRAGAISATARDEARLRGQSDARDGEEDRGERTQVSHGLPPKHSHRA